jgi:hypothetical protein
MNAFVDCISLAGAGIAPVWGGAVAMVADTVVSWEVDRNTLSQCHGAKSTLKNKKPPKIGGLIGTM